MQPDADREERPSLRLLHLPAESTPSLSRGRRWHPSSRTRTNGPLLYICGDLEGRPIFTRIARRWEGVRMVIADDGRTGLQVAAKYRPRLVVLDDTLPDVDAGRLVEHLRKRVLPHETPLIVLGHDPDPRQRARFVWAGASAYFTKPLNVFDIDQSVAILLEAATLG